MPFDLAQARQDTPGCLQNLHFNNAGAALQPQAVYDSVRTYMDYELLHGGYETQDAFADQIQHTYDAIARLVNADPSEIALMENATRAWDLAFYSIPFQPGDRILTSMAEYASNYIAYLQVSQRTGVEIIPIPDDKYGQLSLEALRQIADERVKLISVTHIPTNGGLVNPIMEIGKVAREIGALFLVDACQSIGQLPIDVQKIGCDFLSATGRKYLRAPRGTGFLYVRKEIINKITPVLLDLHSATWVEKDRYEIIDSARRFETWERNLANFVGLGTAADYALNLGLENIWRRIKTLAYQLRSGLAAIPDLIVHDRGVTQSGIVTFTLEGHKAEDIKTFLHQQQIHVSVTTRSSTLLDMDARKLTEMVRASVHYYNSEEEVARFVQVITRLAENA